MRDSENPMSTPERAHVLAKHEERAREIAGELVTDAFWKFGKKPSNKARELCVKWAPIIAQALAQAEARGRAEENEACAKVCDGVPEPVSIDTGQIWRKSAARSLATAIRARQQPPPVL